MPKHYTIGLVLLTGVSIGAVAIAPAQVPARTDTPRPAKLERKDYSEKVSGFRTVTDPNTKKVMRIDMSAGFDMVFISG
ncbi:MAG TPA: hypothetical protein VLM40_00145, partial [Gemmata sp.]|nr:hypothetical protein [Gemmata sp.]